MYFRELLDEDRRAKGNVTKIMNLLGERIMKPEEIGSAMMKALQVDKNGAVYVVHGNSPVIQWPALENGFILSFLIIGRLLTL